MPEYTFFCESCQQNYNIVCSIRDYNDKIPCTSCKSNKKSYRLYTEDVKTQSSSVKKSDGELKTVGDLAQRNTERMSDDHKEYLKQKHNSYKTNKEDKPLPSGMKRVNKPSTKQKWT
jgi:hypothetical protein